MNENIKPFRAFTMPDNKRKGKIEVGKKYYALPRGFHSPMKCEVRKIYNKSALVKILEKCGNEEDEKRRVKLNNETVCPLKNFGREIKHV